MAIDINIPSQVKTFANLAAFPVTGAVKTIYIAEDTNNTYRWTGSVYVEISPSAGGASTWGAITGTLSSQTDLQNALNTKEPTITAGTSAQYYRGDKSFQTLDKNAVSLSNVDNTSDANKPVSTATQTALNAKQDTLVSATNIKTINGSSVLGSGDLVVSGGGDSGFHGLIKPTSALFPNGLVTSFINTTSLPNILQTANRITAYPFVPASTMTSTALVVRCAIGVASALGRIVIYSNVNGEPSTILYQSANLDCSISGDKTVATAFTFTQGVVYWLAFHSSGIQTMSGIQASSMIPIFSTTTTISNHFYRGFSFASGAPSPMLPDTYASGTVTNIGIKLT